MILYSVIKSSLYLELNIASKTKQDIKVLSVLFFSLLVRSW